jgi:tRNA(fMet)-specific endonuclease VapC
LQQDIIAWAFGCRAAHAFGVLGANCIKPNGVIDNLIAAHAISQQAVLVTNKVKDFEDYPGLPVENWV